MSILSGYEERVKRLRREMQEWEERRRQEKQDARQSEQEREAQREERTRQKAAQEMEKKRAEDETRRREAVSALFGARTREKRSRAFAGAQQDKVRLLPVLSAQGGQIAMELKLGRERMYLVRNVHEFAARIARREIAEYGKELTFSHREEEVEERDVPLLRHIALLCGAAERGKMGEFLLSGAPLDETMRLLLGREVELRAQEGKFVEAHVREGDAQVGIQLTRMQSGGAVLRVAAPDVVEGDAGMYVLRAEQGEVLCAFGEAHARVSGLRAVAQSYPRGLRLTDGELDTLCSRVIRPAGSAVRVDRGADIVAEHMPTPVTARFMLDMQGEGRLSCRVRFDYDAQDGEPVRYDSAAEQDALECVRRLFPEEISEDEFAFEGKDDELFELLAQRVKELEAHGEVLATQRLARVNVQKRRAMSFGLTPSGEALLLRADLGGFTQEELREAYVAYRQKRRYVRLESGAFLSGEALEQAAQAGEVLQGVDATAEELSRGVEVDKARAVYLEQALKGREQLHLAASKEATAFIDRLREAQNARAEQPGTLKATLRPYQLDGLTWLCAMNDGGFGGLLADDMGLGKTVQALSLLLREQERGEAVRALVVCPASLQLNWQREAERFAPSLRALALIGGAKEREQGLAQEGVQLLVVSYDQIRRDVQLYEGQAFSHIFLDEAQQIKNAASQAAQAVKTLKAEHRFAMTGTPIENRLSELWSIFDFLMPGYLFTYKRFKERYEAPIVQNGDKKALANLKMMVSPFILRRLKKDVLTDLPEKVEQVMTSAMTDEQRRQYAASAASLMEEMPDDLQSPQGRMRILAGLTHLRQLCCDPRLCLEDYAGGSGKLDQCVELLLSAKAAGHRALLFSQFTSMLALLREALEEAGLSTLTLTGETDKTERQRLCDAFNAGEGDVFLISLKAGGTGLNLTGADTVVHYDPWWNTAAQNQATDRAYRIGQTRGVQVYRLIAAESIEERILSLQEEKLALSDGILEGGEGLSGLDEKALRRLIRGIL